MEIYVVRPGDTAATIARQYGLSLSQLVLDNGLSDPARLVPGQALVLRFPTQTYTVQPGDTLFSVSRRTGQSLRQLWRNNPILAGTTDLYPGQTLVLSYRQEGTAPATVGGYAYAFVDRSLLRATLPHLTWMAPFTYGFTPQGDLVVPDDRPLIALARAMGTAPVLHLSTLSPEGSFSNELASLALNDAAVQDRLLAAVEATLRKKGYDGLDVDFEFLFPQDAGAYAAFLGRLRDRLAPQGYFVAAALAPKTSANQPGLLYEGHDYAAIGAAVDRVLLMTYEWGYT